MFDYVILNTRDGQITCESIRFQATEDELEQNIEEIKDNLGYYIGLEVSLTILRADKMSMQERKK